MIIRFFMHHTLYCDEINVLYCIFVFLMQSKKYPRDADARGFKNCDYEKKIHGKIYIQDNGVPTLV